MASDYTPARLRELAEICDPPVDHINLSLAAPDIAAALRAAADTLAAREALLRRVLEHLDTDIWLNSEDELAAEIAAALKETDNDRR